MNESDNKDRAVQALKAGRLREKIMRSGRHCGITSQELALLECGESNEPLVRKTLEWLSKPNAMGFPALLESMPMRLEGRKGRPQQAYLLTEFGKLVLNELDPNLKARINKPKDAKDLNHRFALLDVFTRALQNGWQAQIEKVLRYGSGKEIRCDLLIHRPAGKLYIEIEQGLTRNNAARAVEKFRNWQAYALSTNSAPDLVFVFNLPDTRLGPTLAIWQEALGAEDFSLDVRYILVGMLEGQMFDTALKSFGVRMEPSDPVVPDAGSAAAPDISLPNASELLPDFDARVNEWDAAYHPADKVSAFFALMVQFYAASYGHGSLTKNDSDAYQYNELPVKSLWLLRHYLNLPQNQIMYAELKHAMIWVQRRGSMGLIMLRNTICLILWDTFLKHHQLSMGGNLRMTLEVPDYTNFNSNFEVKVHMFEWENIFESDTQRDEACRALGWVLTTFFWYPEILGTGEKPWKNSKKLKAKNQADSAGDE